MGLYSEAVHIGRFSFMSPNQDDYDTDISYSNNHFIPAENIIYERYLFRIRYQHEYYWRILNHPL